MKIATTVLLISLLGGCASYTSATSKDGGTVVNAACFMVACQVEGKVIVGKGAE
jgi:galactokinase/mevalonate kinase-like predicted kinase